MSIFAPNDDAYRLLLKVASSSVAHPAGFASPADVEEDERALTLCFDVADAGDLRVEVDPEHLTIWHGPHRETARALRACALPCAVVPDALETWRDARFLRVRVAKKASSVVSPIGEPSA